MIKNSSKAICQYRIIGKTRKVKMKLPCNNSS